MSMLSPSLDQGADQLHRAFTEARPFRHVVIDGFFEPGFCRELQADFPGFEARYARNEMGEVGGKAVRPDLPSISESFARLDRLLQSDRFLGLMGRITGIEGLLYDPDYVGGGTHENTQGQGLSPHVDFNRLPGSGWHRRLNLIVYLDDIWSDSWGGCLDLHSDPWDGTADQVTRLVPAFNRCVIFETTEHSWHGFEAIDLPEGERHRTRRSIAVYLYTRERDAAETAPSHGTVYVPAGLPRDIRVGKALSEPVHRELERRFTQLRGQLKFLYRRELEASAQTAALMSALEEARAAVAFPLQGYQVQEGPVRGYWPDGWMGPTLEAGFRLGRVARSLRIDLWIPPQLGEDPKVTVCVNGQTQERQVVRGESTSFEFEMAMEAGDRLELRIGVSNSFIPAVSESSNDDRQLACRVVGAMID